LKLLQENIGKAFDNVCVGSDCLNATILTKEIRARNDKLYCIKLKSFFTSMETITRMKRKLID
jgi:hypothetical protein